jgi:hypothetical protein
MSADQHAPFSTAVVIVNPMSGYRERSRRLRRATARSEHARV